MTKGKAPGKAKQITKAQLKKFNKKMKSLKVAKASGASKEEKKAIKKQIKQEEIISLRTNSGNTQQTERNNIGLVKHVLDDMHIHYEEASSQQSKDFWLLV